MSRAAARRALPLAPLIVLLVALLVAGGPARAALFGSDRLDPGFCAAPQLRQTVFYVDDMAMVDGRTDWALKLLGKLRATLAPGERVTVVRLSPATGQSSEQWTGCWPDYAIAERERRARETYFFQKSPLAQLEDQQRFFARDLGEALTRVYAAGKRPAAAVAIDPANPPPKEILRALASDEGRFAHSPVTVRAVVYSDLAENSDLGTAFRPVPPGGPGIGRKLGSYLRRSVFYAYGVGAEVRGGGAAQDATRAFWNAALRSMGATVGGLGADLNMASGVPAASADYDLELELDKEKLDGRMQLLTDADGALVDSWLGISRLTSAALSGTFRCTDARPEAREPACRLNAATAGGVATTGSSETVVLTGTARDALHGQIGVRNSPVAFPLRASRGGS